MHKGITILFFGMLVLPLANRALAQSPQSSTEAAPYPIAGPRSASALPEAGALPRPMLLPPVGSVWAPSPAPAPEPA